MSELESRLRASLAAQARHAPPGEELAERIIADAAHGSVVPIQSARRWRSWTLPLIASAAVAAVAAVLVGISAGGRHTASAPPATQLHSAGLLHTATPSEPTPTSAPTTAPTTAPAQPAATASNAVGIDHFQAVDLSFAGAHDGWALGSANCLNGSGGACTAMVYTHDSGKSWHSMTPPGASVALQKCADSCVSHVRFATPEIGYAFGPAALFMTTDGGRTWTDQGGGAEALETLDGNVVRVTTTCVPGCGFWIQTAPVGTPKWHTVAKIDGGMSPGVALSRIGSDAYLAVFGHTAGGAGSATTALWVSRDDGATWTDRGEPCRQEPVQGGEVDSSAVATAVDGSVSVLCVPRTAADHQAISTATGPDKAFRQSGLQALGPATALAAASQRVLLVASDRLYRSTDAGASFTAVPDVSGPPRWLGFESATLGRALSDDGRTIWTTRDAGASWSAYAFG
jgi:hypothetical protein